ncbi:MAG: hypothetical protein MJZ61_02475 [Bacteroidales bacterium]|nr:hypothetical protein [Bacteroidales bacterium]
MNTAEKTLLLKKLANEDDSELASTLHYFRENGDIELLPNVLELLSSNRSQDIKDNVLQLCADIKNPEAADMAFAFMMATQNAEVKKSVITALWQTGNNFSHKAGEIVDIIIDSPDFETAFEALTLLENCAVEIEKEPAGNLHNKVAQAAENASETKAGILKAAQTHLLELSLGRKIERGF